MGYRASNNRDRDNAAEWLALPLSERLRQVNWPGFALLLIFVAAFAIPDAKHWFG